MRPIPGLDRPGVQWLFVALCLLLTGLAAAGALALRRASAQNGELHAQWMEARGEAERMEDRLIREQSTREAFALELARQRSIGTAPPMPTVTVHPATRRTGEAPEATVGAPGQDQLIQLRLVLPKGKTVPPGADLELVLRGWSNGKMVWSRGNLRVTTLDGRPAVVANVAGDVFAPGAYEIIVRAETKELATYEVGVR